MNVSVKTEWWKWRDHSFQAAQKLRVGWGRRVIAMKGKGKNEKCGTWNSANLTYNKQNYTLLSFKLWLPSIKVSFRCINWIWHYFPIIICKVHPSIPHRIPAACARRTYLFHWLNLFSWFADNDCHAGCTSELTFISLRYITMTVSDTFHLHKGHSPSRCFIIILGRRRLFDSRLIFRGNQVASFPKWHSALCLVTFLAIRYFI